MTKPYLFIGGSQDGEWIDVDTHGYRGTPPPYVVMPKARALRDDSLDPNAKVEIERYVSHNLRFGHHEELPNRWVFVINGMSTLEAYDRLTQNYAPTQKHARRLVRLHASCAF